MNTQPTMMLSLKLKVITDTQKEQYILTNKAKTTYNSTYPKVAVQWLNQAL